MQDTLMVKGIYCKTIVVDEVWYIIIDNKQRILYHIRDKNREKYVFKIKAICEVCNKKYFARISGRIKYCGKSCSSKIKIKRTNAKFIGMSNDKELKQKANSFINNAIKAGKIIRPKVCSNCNGYDDIHAHHPDYNKPNEVKWWCRSCHWKFHYGDISVKGKLITYTI